MGRRPWTVHCMVKRSAWSTCAWRHRWNRGPDLLRELPCLRGLREAGQRAHRELTDPVPGPGGPERGDLVQRQRSRPHRLLRFTLGQPDVRKPEQVQHPAPHVERLPAAQGRGDVLRRHPRAPGRLRATAAQGQHLTARARGSGDLRRTEQGVPRVSPASALTTRAPMSSSPASRAASRARAKYQCATPSRPASPDMCPAIRARLPATPNRRRYTARG